jgi:hypothetical protein
MNIFKNIAGFLPAPMLALITLVVGACALIRCAVSQPDYALTGSRVPGPTA